MNRLDPIPRSQTALQLLAWCGLVLVLCPALTDFSAVDLPDEFLEFHVGSLSFFADELASGQISWWNPYKHGGGSVFADPICLAPFYPMALLLPVLPLDLFIQLAWVLHLGLGALGVQRWTRELGAGFAGSTAAALCVLLGSNPIIALVDGSKPFTSNSTSPRWKGKSKKLMSSRQ